MTAAALPAAQNVEPLRQSFAWTADYAQSSSCVFSPLPAGVLQDVGREPLSGLGARDCRTGPIHASWDSHLCICPQAGQRTGIGTRGRLLRRTHSVLRPVEIGVPVRGHLTNMSATCDPLGDRTNIRRPVASATFVHTTLPWARSCALNMGAGTAVSAVRNFPSDSILARRKSPVNS